MPSAIRIGLGLVLGLALAGCARSGPRSAVDLVAASKEAYELLDPEVLRSVELYLEDFRRSGAGFAGQAEVEAHLTGTSTADYGPRTARTERRSSRKPTS